MLKASFFYLLNTFFPNLFTKTLINVSNIEIKSRIANILKYFVISINNKISKCLNRELCELLKGYHKVEVNVFKNEEHKIAYVKWLEVKKSEIENKTIKFSNLSKKRNFIPN